MPYNTREIPTKLTPEEAERFWSYVALPPSPDECWLWEGALNNKGYGRFNLRGQALGAHRVSYTISRGVIPPEMVLDHLCRNPRCINPSHLETVTQRENVLRGDLPRVMAERGGSPDDPCPKGHEPNWGYYRYNGPDRPRTRGCKTCNNERARKRAARKREQLGG